MLGLGSCPCPNLPLGSERHGRSTHVWNTTQSPTAPAQGGRGGELTRSQVGALDTPQQPHAQDIEPGAAERELRQRVQQCALLCA